MNIFLPNTHHAKTFLCVVLMIITFSSLQAQLDYGKSYVNLTKGLSGGTVEPGDVLQIRATFVVKSGTYDSCAFYSTIPAGTTYVTGSLAVLTNEGKVYKAFTDAANDDCGKIVGSNVTIHMGYLPGATHATAFKRGTIRNTDKPSFFGSSCIMIASFKVTVTSGYGSTLNLGGGTITYKNGSNPLNSITYPAKPVYVFKNSGICSNTVGGNALGAEFNGTFGSGKPRNRGTSASVPVNYAFQYFTTGSPQDYYYGIANNTSTQNYTTSNAWPKPDNTSPSHRVFNVWDIIGDHTGATNPLLGNPAADTVASATRGYMLVINAAYRTDSAFNHNITGLCPNTYYELSAWVRNICSRCGCDSMGRGAGSAGYIPTAAGDSSGVYPNLTFTINGVDYYSSGDMKYTGEWVKKGFTYLTGPAQTSLTMSINNNAPGGGGNDWAIDDISIATCTPNLAIFPSPTANVCYGDQVDIYADVKSFFDNYIHYRWEKSIDGGATWTLEAPSTGSPVLVSGEYVYTATYPSFLGDSSRHNNIYRLRVASSAANLSDNSCSFIASTTIRIFVNNCKWILKTSLTNFDALLKNNFAALKWDTENEMTDTRYVIEKSIDKIQYKTIGTVYAANGNGNGGSYNFNDPEILTGPTYYRIMIDENQLHKYSKVVLLNPNGLKFEIKALENPFNKTLKFDIIAPANGVAQIAIIDNYGRIIKQQNITVEKGINSIKLFNTTAINNGVYTLRVQLNEQVINKRILKVNE
jgi:hypothetical protein